MSPSEAEEAWPRLSPGERLLWLAVLDTCAECRTPPRSGTMHEYSCARHRAVYLRVLELDDVESTIKLGVYEAPLLGDDRLTPDEPDEGGTQ